MGERLVRIQKVKEINKTPQLEAGAFVFYLH